MENFYYIVEMIGYKGKRVIDIVSRFCC